MVAWECRREPDIMKARCWALDTHSFSCLYQLRNAEDVATLQTALETMNKELEKLSEIDWMNSILVPEVC